jgi:hypothetical protein
MSSDSSSVSFFSFFVQKCIAHPLCCLALPQLLYSLCGYPDHADDRPLPGRTTRSRLNDIGAIPMDCLEAASLSRALLDCTHPCQGEDAAWESTTVVPPTMGFPTRVRCTLLRSQPKIHVAAQPARTLNEVRQDPVNLVPKGPRSVSATCILGRRTSDLAVRKRPLPWTGTEMHGKLHTEHGLTRASIPSGATPWRRRSRR